MKTFCHQRSLKRSALKSLRENELNITLMAILQRWQFSLVFVKLKKNPLNQFQANFSILYCLKALKNIRKMFSGVFRRYEIRTWVRKGLTYSAQKMKFSNKDFFSKCDQIRRKLRVNTVCSVNTFILSHNIVKIIGSKFLLSDVIMP